MFQYFLKVGRLLLKSLILLNLTYRILPQVVSTKFTFLDGRELNTHQYSVTQYERDRSPPFSAIQIKTSI